jgi:uncharacterized protein (DUF697 family)
VVVAVAAVCNAVLDDEALGSVALVGLLLFDCLIKFAPALISNVGAAHAPTTKAAITAKARKRFVFFIIVLHFLI